MPIKEIPVCAKCGKGIEPEPELGDRQGCLMHIKGAAETWALWLCSGCKQPLYELYFDHVEQFLPDGTLSGLDRMAYLPRGK